MKTFLKSLKRQDGFTLVELMVVVAIIGLLSSVAIPNFKKYQAKSKISEAKLQLSSLYTAEAAFFSDYNIYGHCLRYMGFDPQPEMLNRYYGVGFPAGLGNRDDNAHTTSLNSGLQNAQCPDNQTERLGSTGTVADGDIFNTATWYPAGKGIGSQIIDITADAAANTAGAAQGTCTEVQIGTTTGTGSCTGTQIDAANMTFQASAVGIISGNAMTNATASGLTINHNKIIKTLVNGY
jgi:type IV pilus assembly protein PilA